MLIFADSRCPALALEKLGTFGEVVPFETNGLVYESISGHPDVFFVKIKNKLLVAPNMPDEYKAILRERNISFIEGKSEVGKTYPKTAVYNAIITENYFVHNLKTTDSGLLVQTENLKKIHVNQAYTRCNLLALKENNFITSDRGIEKVLRKKQCEVLYVNPEKIILPGMKNGFFGGCCGIFNEAIFLIGNLDFLDEGKKAREFIEGLGYKLVELFNGPLFDGGSLIFIPSHTK